jgi:hypothetical protein
MSNCISHTGLFDDWDNPVDDKGQLFMPGLRLCLHSDCVNPTHLKGYRDRRTKHGNLKYDSEIYAEIIRLGNLEPGDAELCSLANCSEPRKARNLCRRHWSMFRHRQPEQIVRHHLYSLSDFPPLDKPVPRTDRSSLGHRTCNFISCQNKSRQRGLCPTHWQNYMRTYKREKGIKWKSTQSV